MPIVVVNNKPTAAMTNAPQIQLTAELINNSERGYRPADTTEAMTHAQQSAPAPRSQPTSPSASPGMTIIKNSAMSNKTLADIVKEGEWKPEKRDAEWTLIQRNQYRNRFVGNKGKGVQDPKMKFRAAEIKVPIFVYHVEKELSISDIHKYIASKTDIKVSIEKVSMRELRDYESYKIYVPKHKIDIFMQDNFWPEGISFRRFYEFREKKLGRDKARIVNN